MGTSFIKSQINFNWVSIVNIFSFHFKLVPSPLRDNNGVSQLSGRQNVDFQIEYKIIHILRCKQL